MNSMNNFIFETSVKKAYKSECKQNHNILNNNNSKFERKRMG